MTLTEKDVCILIPTYNRPADLERLIISIGKNKKNVRVIILDQSKDDKTKEIAQNFDKFKIKITYKKYKIPSKNNALNNALEGIKEKFKLICLIDDDVEIFPDLISKLLEHFNNNEKIIGIGAVDLKEFTKNKNLNYNSLKFKMFNKLLEILLLPNQENHKIRIIGPYGNTMTPKIERDITNCEWIPGFLMCYRNEIFEDYKIPERIGYDVSEDIDMSYFVFRKYGRGSLAIFKDVRVYHHYSQSERYADKKRIFVNHEDHLNFYFRQFPGVINRIKYLWELFGIILLNLIRIILRPNKENILKGKYLFEALSYCWRYKKEIKSGKSRFFLNDDLSIKETF